MPGSVPIREVGRPHGKVETLVPWAAFVPPHWHLSCKIRKKDKRAARWEKQMRRGQQTKACSGLAPKTPTGFEASRFISEVSVYSFRKDVARRTYS